MKAAGGNATVPECIQAQVVADLLGVTVAGLCEWDAATLYATIGYHEGKAVAQWARENPAKKQD